MIYTISLKENKIEKKDEIFYFEMAQSYELTDLGINKIIYNDDTDEKDHPKISPNGIIIGALS